VTRNDFSSTWYTVFLETMPLAATEAEIAFVLRHLPPARFPRLLDLCCGPGRHATQLATHGYTILGIDNNPDAIAKARRSPAANLTYLVHDMREIAALPGAFDGAINLWHSFGYFDDATNLDVLRQVRDKLRPGGRFVLDIYNRSSLERLPTTQRVDKAGVRIVTEHTWAGKRLTCSLRYNDGEPGDTFEWRLYTPDEILAMASDLGFRCLVACAWCDEQLPPAPDHARMQFVLEREDTR
jgi:SAM-dependent methyltransferase